MRTQYELKKKERASSLANMSLEQHAFSYNQPNQFKIPELPTASGNIRDVVDQSKDTSSPATPAKSQATTPAKSFATTPGAGPSQATPVESCRDRETDAHTTGTALCDDDELSCMTAPQQAQKKRKWYSIF